MEKPIIIKKSSIDGKGVFANKDFKKGKIILEWNLSKTLTKEQAEKNKNKDYITFLKGKYVLMQSPEKYINHSCNANTFAKNFCDIAKRNIKKGEEITANYIEEVPKGFFMKCNCKSKNCKGFIRK